MKIVETDNYGGDYPDEKFLNLPSYITKEQAQKIANAINDAICSEIGAPRFWVVRENDYQLQPGFEP